MNRLCPASIPYRALFAHGSIRLVESARFAEPSAIVRVRADGNKQAIKAAAANRTRGRNCGAVIGLNLLARFLVSVSQAEAAAIKKPAENCQKNERFLYRLKSELLLSGHDQYLSGKLHLT